MAFSINSFKTNGLVNGGARPTLFEVQLVSPVGTLSVNHPFLIKAAQIPAASVDSIDVGYFGRKIKVAGDRTFTDWTVTVINDEDFSIRQVLEKWSNDINQLEGNKQIIGTALSAYKTNLTVRQFSKSGDESPIAEYIFVGAFPTSVDAIRLDWDSTNQIEEFDVTFAYDYWIPNSSSSVGAPGGGVTSTYDYGIL